MEIISVKASKREKQGTKEARRMRKQDLIPAVLYGGQSQNEMLTLPKAEANKLLGHGTRLIDLVLPDKSERVLVKEIEYSSLDESIIHIDFARVAMDEKITLSVEIVLKGEPKGAKEGGILEQNLREMEIECLPTAIPEKIEVDIRHLELDAVVRVKDIKLPEGVTFLSDPDVTVAGVHPPRVEEEVVAPAEGAVEPEVITQKKPTEEEGESSEEKPASGGKEKEQKK